MKKEQISQIYDIFLELTNICNFHCPFCPYDQMKRPKGLMEKELAKKIIRQIKEENISNRIAFFLMGEPLLHPDFFEIAEYASSLGLYGLIHTNALLMNKKNRALLLNSGIKEINISLETFGDKAFQEKYRGKNFTFQKYLNQILEFLARHYQEESSILIKIHFFTKSWLQYFKGSELNTFLTEDFQEVLAFFVQWIKNNIKKEIEFPKLPFSFNNEYEIEILPQIRLLSRQVQSFGGSMGKEKKYKAKFGSCRAIHDQIGILWNGDVVPCCVDYDGRILLGNINEKKILEIVNSEPAVCLVSNFKKGKIIHPVCSQCRGGSSLWKSLIKQSASIIQSSGILDFTTKKKI